MCGIAGFKINKRVDDQVLNRMVQELYHRGPDMDGYYRQGSYQAGMRRLMINDLDTGGQPFYNRDESVVVFYNGEIYNSPQLRQDLMAKGYRFRTSCDGEVICHMFDEYGLELFEKLDGMFAIALWQKNENRLILARDIPGEKPLYYSQISNNEVVFASEIKSLKLFSGLDLKLNKQAIWDFPTFLWIPEPLTVYENVYALMPGHLLIVDDNGLEIKKYPNKFSQVDGVLTEEELVSKTREVVENSIKSRLLSDVPIGSFLSGGLDSSIVATIASQHVDQLDTFTVGFEDVEDPYHGKADESLAAAEYAKQLGTNHHTIRVNADTFKNELDTFCKYGDQPFAVSSGLGLLMIAHAAKDAGIKVLLSGDGADEIFGGYSWYEYFPMQAQESSTENLVGDVSGQNHGLSWQERVNHLSSYDAQKKAWAWHYYASENEKASLFSEEVVGETKTSLRYFTEYNSAQEWSHEDFIRQDRQFYLPNEMLKKVDRMTMAYSIEGRPPFVAPSVLALAEQFKYSHLIKDGNLKWVLRKAFEDVLPNDIIYRPKHGFNVPIDHWLKNDWADMVDETFDKSSALNKNGLINEKSLVQAKKMVNDKDRLNGHSIFCFIMLNKWLQEHH
jgi:asparagine synthase (glutamine-hydrolysing)